MIEYHAGFTGIPAKNIFTLTCLCALLWGLYFNKKGVSLAKYILVSAVFASYLVIGLFFYKKMIAQDLYSSGDFHLVSGVVNRIDEYNATVKVGIEGSEIHIHRSDIYCVGYESQFHVGDAIDVYYVSPKGVPLMSRDCVVLLKIYRG